MLVNNTIDLNISKNIPKFEEKKYPSIRKTIYEIFRTSKIQIVYSEYETSRTFSSKKNVNIAIIVTLFYRA